MCGRSRRAMPTMPPRRIRPRLRPCTAGSSMSRLHPATVCWVDADGLTTGSGRLTQDAEHGPAGANIVEVAVEHRLDVGARRSREEPDRTSGVVHGDPEVDELAAQALDVRRGHG